MAKHCDFAHTDNLHVFFLCTWSTVHVFSKDKIHVYHFVANVHPLPFSLTSSFGCLGGDYVLRPGNLYTQMR